MQPRGDGASAPGKHPPEGDTPFLRSGDETGHRTHADGQGRIQGGEAIDHGRGFSMTGSSGIRVGGRPRCPPFKRSCALPPQAAKERGW